MTPARAGQAVALIFALGFILASSATAAPRQPAASPASPAARGAQPAPAAPTFVSADDQDAGRTREQLEAILQRSPSSLGRVLKLDPSLLINRDYLAPYPALSAFVAQHPEIARDPRFFFENVYIGSQSAPPTRESEMLDLWRRLTEGIAFFLVFLVITGTLAWLIKLLVDYRRWLRLSKTQVEVHNKLLDRFTATEDLIAYVQSPAGRRFLESAPIAPEPPLPDLAGSLRWVLWGVQAGLVLAAGGLGLLFVSYNVMEGVQQPLFATGVLALSLGLGFVAAAAVSYFLSRRLGMFERIRPRSEPTSADPGA